MTKATRTIDPDGLLPDGFAEALHAVPEIACAAVIPGAAGCDLWVIVDADPVAAGRAVIPLIGQLLATRPTAVADFHVLPREGRPMRNLLPDDAVALWAPSA